LRTPENKVTAPYYTPEKPNKLLIAAAKRKSNSQENNINKKNTIYEIIHLMMLRKHQETILPKILM